MSEKKTSDFTISKVVIAAAIVGIVCALILCGIRMGMERRHNQVTVVMSRADIELLASAEGIGLDEYLRLMRKHSDLPLTIIPGTADNALDLYLLDGEAYRNPNGAIVGLIEDDAQYSFVPIPGFNPDGSVPMVRVFKLFPDIASRYAVLGYSGPQELTNIFFRAVTDRNIRVIWLTPFTHSETGELISSPGEYARILIVLKDRLRRMSLGLGDSFSVLDSSYSPSPPLIIGTFWGICAAGVLLFINLFPQKRNKSTILTLLSGLTASIAYLLTPELTLSGAALFASIVFPCLAMAVFLEKTLSLNGGLTGYRAVLRYTSPLACSVGIAIIGGLFIGALLSASRYLLAIDNFRGVKVSQILPLIIGGFIVLLKLYGSFSGVASEIFAGRKLFLVASVCLVIAAGILFILRTGDGMLAISVFEQRLRNALELWLPARPRTKEFLAAWPCAAATVALVAANWRRYAWPFAIISMTGFSSIVNTFCHSRAPLNLSINRTLIGFVLGYILGLMLNTVLYGIRSIMVKK